MHLLWPRRAEHSSGLALLVLLTQLTMRPDPLREAVAHCIHETLAETASNLEFHAFLRDLLSQPGRALAPEGKAKWLRFVADPCDALGGDPALVPYAAAAVEFVITAADVVDDLADGDWDSGRRSPGRGINASLALSHLAQRAIDHLAPLCPAHRLTRLRTALNTNLLRACAGEDLDLQFEARPNVGVEQAHMMTVLKSGSLVAMACTIGGALATDDSTVLDLVASFGCQLGVIAQLLNDSAALKPGEAHTHSDLARRKKTLPIAFALHYAHQQAHHIVRRWADTAEPITQAEHEELVSAIDRLGGVHYAWVVADMHRREALVTLRALQQHTGRREVWALRHLLPQLRAKTKPPRT